MVLVQKLPRPSKLIEKLDLWVDEAIWGHRLHDEQTPWLCLMEFLNVVQAEKEAGRALIENEPNSLAYVPEHRLYLRNILFNNPKIIMIMNQYTDNNMRWENWVRIMEDDCGGIDDAPDFSYLKERFGEFDNFVSIIEFLNQSTIEGENNKRWSSQFLFPYGPQCLYEDLQVKPKGSTQNDRRFFARTGELLYLMLCRSSKSQEVLQQLDKIFLTNTKLNSIVGALQPEIDQKASKPRSGAYLPYLKLPEYDRLADDLIGLFSRNMPSYDVFPHLVNLIGLHMIIYSINRAKEVLQDKSGTTFLLEIVSPRRTVIRDVAGDSYADNNGSFSRAIEHYINQVVESVEWQEALEGDDPINAIRELLTERYAVWRDGDEDEIVAITNPYDLLKTLREKALNRHKQHVNKFHSVWSREIGLSSRRGSRRVRYAPNDSLLKTLVLTNVNVRMEFNEFLETLYKKYGFIIGDKQAQNIINDGRADREAFTENKNRLEERLASMGLLHRLSDACAYVENPFAKEATR